MTTRRRIPHALFLAVLVLLVCAAAAAQTVRYTPDSREVVEGRLQKYAGNDTQRETTLKQLFAEAGCDTQHLTEQPVKGSKLPNLICVLPGSTDATIIVGAHFDHIPAGDGVVDNWSGASLLPSLYDALKNEPRTHTYVLIGFTDEERGEVGSHFYAQHMTKDEVERTDAMVNMDTLGLAPTEVWTSHSDRRLNGALFHLAHQLNIPVTGMNVDKVGSTDSVQFAARKIPSITIHSLTQKAFDDHVLHTAKDRLSAVHMDDYYQSYRLIAAYLAYLDTFSRTPAQPTLKAAP